MNSLETQIAMVSAGHGATVIPSLGLPACRKRGIVVQRLTNPAVTVDYHLIQQRGKEARTSGGGFRRFSPALHRPLGRSRRHTYRDINARPAKIAPHGEGFTSRAACAVNATVETRFRIGSRDPHTSILDSSFYATSVRAYSASTSLMRVW